MSLGTTPYAMQWERADPKLAPRTKACGARHIRSSGWGNGGPTRAGAPARLGAGAPG